MAQPATNCNPEVGTPSIIEILTELLRRREIRQKYVDSTSASERMMLRYEGGAQVFPELFTEEFLAYESEFIRLRSYVILQVISKKEWKKIYRSSNSTDAMLELADAKTKELMELPELPPYIEKWLDWTAAKAAFDAQEFDKEFRVNGVYYEARLTTEALNAHEERMQPCDLYRFYDYRGELLYIGISSSALRRASEHAKHSQWFSRFSTMEREVCFNRDEAEKAERKAIREENPLFNITHSTRGTEL